MSGDKNLLEVKGLHTCFNTKAGVVKAVDGVDFAIGDGSTLAIVGESGCGKSVTALSIMRLVPSPVGRIESGQIILEGRNLLELSKSEMRRMRGNKISMVFQEPMTSLNPVMRVGDQIAEVARLHQGLSRNGAFCEAVEMLRLVGIADPQKSASRYPHEMSGGMRQRAMIAMAVCCRPRLLVADEPTTALDVTIQSQILDIIRKLQEEIGTAIILITHNMGVVAEMARNVAVMYAGRIVEYAPVEELFGNPRHPYTQGLLECVPRLDRVGEKKRLHTIPGIVPSLVRLQKGCKFSDRCRRAMPQCLDEEPPLFRVNPEHDCRCWLSA